MSESLEINWWSEHLVLLHDGALHWPSRQTLFVADLHLGKPEHFRRMGTPVPEQVTRHDLQRLSTLIHGRKIRRLVILGDLFHARSDDQSQLERVLRDWRHEIHWLEILLVRGNHDHRAGDPHPVLQIDCVDDPHKFDPFVLAHNPEASEPQHPTLAGHLHPAVRLAGPGSRPLRLRCFWITPFTIVLPAFGTFTGTHLVRPTHKDRVVVIGPGAVAEVSPVQADNQYPSL